MSDWFFIQRSVSTASQVPRMNWRANFVSFSDYCKIRPRLALQGELLTLHVTCLRFFNFHFSSIIFPFPRPNRGREPKCISFNDVHASIFHFFAFYHPTTSPNFSCVPSSVSLFRTRKTKLWDHGFIFMLSLMDWKKGVHFIVVFPLQNTMYLFFCEIKWSIH